MKLRGSNIRRIKSFFHIQKYLKIHQLQIIKKDKENLQKKKKLVKGINIFMKKKKTKSENMVLYDVKISQKTKNICL